MTIREMGNGIVFNTKKPRSYRIGFVNNYGEEDVTELDATGIRDLEELWNSLCGEFECKLNSVNYIERVERRE